MENATKPAFRAVWIGHTMHWPQTDEEFKERMAELEASVAERTSTEPHSLQMSEEMLAETLSTLCGNYKYQ